MLLLFDRGKCLLAWLLACDSLRSLCAANIMPLMLYVSTASSCGARYFSNCCVCFIETFVWFADCDAIAMIGHNNVLSTACQSN